MALGRESSWGRLSSPMERSLYCCGAFSAQKDSKRTQNFSFRVQRAHAYLGGWGFSSEVGDLAPFLASSSAHSFPIIPACPGIQQTCTWPAGTAWRQLERLGQTSAVSWKAWMTLWLEPLGHPCSCWATSWLSRRTYRFCVYGAWKLLKASFSPSVAATASASNISCCGSGRWPQADSCFHAPQYPYHPAPAEALFNRLPSVKRNMESGGQESAHC